MNQPERQILLKVDDRVFGHLSKMAAELGRSPTRYALELFEAAYAVRCGVSEDPALAAAIVGGEAKAAPAAAPDPAIGAELAKVRRERDAAQRAANRVPELQRELDDIRAKHQLLSAFVRSDAERPARDEAALAELRRERDALQDKVDELQVKVDETPRLEAMARRLRNQIADHEAAIERGRNAPAARTAPISDLSEAIAELKAVAVEFREAIADQKLQGDQLDQLYRRTREALERSQRGSVETTIAPPPVATPAPQPAAAAPAATPAPSPSVAPAQPKPAKTSRSPAARPVWKKSWGTGR